jgi:hypothetical protein
LRERFERPSRDTSRRKVKCSPTLTWRAISFRQPDPANPRSMFPCHVDELEQFARIHGSFIERVETADPKQSSGPSAKGLSGGTEHDGQRRMDRRENLRRSAAARRGKMRGRTYAVAWYDDHAEALVESHESVAPEKVNAWLKNVLPSQPALASSSRCAARRPKIN